MRRFILEEMHDELERLEEEPLEINPKGQLQETLQAISPRSPVYELLSQHGREHEKTFAVRVVWENQVLGEGSGRSKKQAESAAALAALKEKAWTKISRRRCALTATASSISPSALRLTCASANFIYTGPSFMAESSDTKDMKEFQLHEKDTGSADVQVALLTRRIAQLTEHLKSHAKDHSSRRGLLKMVATRRSLLDYLSRSKNDRYKSVIEKLNLRK